MLQPAREVKVVLETLVVVVVGMTTLVTGETSVSEVALVAGEVALVEIGRASCRERVCLYV